MTANGSIVFGGSGFIGTHLVRHLREADAGPIVSVDIRPPRERLDGVVYVTADVRDLSSFAPQGSFGRIYNFAAIHTTPGHDTHEYYETNIAGAVEITRFARRAGIDEIVFTSSISVYGPTEEMKSEDSPPQPNSAYGWSKWLAEKIQLAWLDEAAERRLTIVRPAVVFGPGEGGNFTRLAGLLRRGLFVFAGRRDTIKACIYVGDLIEALDYAHGLGERRVLFNGAYPERYTIEDIVTAFCAHHFPNVRLFTVPEFALRMIAAMLKPFSAVGLGIHPDRVRKLSRSTNILPGWLISQGHARYGRLPVALEDWATATNGRFD